MKKNEATNEPGSDSSVSGTITATDGSSLSGLLVELFAISGDAKTELGSTPVGKGGAYSIAYTPPAHAVLNLQVQVIAPNGAVLGNSRLVRNTKPNLRLDLAISRGAVFDPQARFAVHVRVAGEGAPAVDGLRVDVVDRRVGGDVVLASDPTDSAGRLATSFALDALLADGRDRPDLQARVYQDGKLLGQSALHIDAVDGVTLDVTLRADQRRALASEAESLAREVRPHYAGALAALREDGEQRDITLLARKSGWDARLIAMSAAAERFSDLSSAGGNTLAPEWFYALFRAGLPADPDALFATGPAQVESIWKKALDNSVIPARLAPALGEAMARFGELRSERLLGGEPTVGISPASDMLRLSLGDDVRKHEQFAQIHEELGTEPAKFWKAIEKKFGAEGSRLRIDGQLALLTLNNAPLVAALHQVADHGRVAEPRELVTRGFYKPANWEKVLAGAPLPREIDGADDGERRARYAELMAATLRINYPTAVLAAMVRDGESTLRNDNGKPASAGLRAAVGDFLQAHQDTLFLGTQSVDQYIHQKAIRNLKPEVVRELRRLQRVYQVTPGDAAMNVLLSEGVDSAYAIVNHDRESFVERFKNKLAGAAEAELVYAKAEQVHGAVLNLTVAYLSAKNAPGIGVHSPAHIINPAPNVPNPNATDILAYAALEQLFGEMDYCECEHCRSVLSPAAYLVSLLQFLAPPGHPDPTPQRVLLERRPDIQHLPLTCENTNTPLPQIDLVNETLEYFVAADSPVAAPQVAMSLGGFTGHDTPPGTRPAELLASPAYVREAAYKVLESASFPILLPLFQPLESLRRHFAKFEAPLGRVMEALRATDAPERAGALTDPAYGWRDVFLEELRISRAEYALLTDSTRPFWELFGYANGTAEAALLPQLAGAKAFARRIDVTYEELVRVLGTQFVNPNAALIPKLLRLGVPFATLKQLKDGAITPNEFRAAIAPQLDLAEYGGDVVAWVMDNANYDRIMSLLTLVDPNANPADADLCNFDNLEFRYALPDNAANAARGIEYLRLLRFIRLWRKLGWPLELVDQAITALYPANQRPDQPLEATNRTRLDAGFQVLLLRLGIVKRALDDLGLDPKRELTGLLACCAPMGTRGADSLYRRLFLGTEFLRQHPQFGDDGYGNFLDDPAGRVLAQREALRGALQLTDEEFSLIVEALQFDGNTVLDVANVSRIHHYGWLARRLRLSVAEFIALVREAVIDPFGAPVIGANPQPAVPALLRFLRLVADLRAVELQPAQAAYLIWNRDLSGRSAPLPAAIASFAIALRRDLMGIEAEMSVVVDPEGTVARERMALVYGAETTETFFGLLEGTLVTQASYSHAASELDAATLAIAPNRLSYDDLRKQLSFKGVMTTALQGLLSAGQPVPFQTAIDALFAANQRIVAPFFAAFPELRQAFDNYVASNAPLEQRRTQLLSTFLPILAQRRSRQLALQAMSAEVRSSVDFAATLLERQSRGVYLLHAIGDPARPGLDDLVALGVPGLAARFFFRATATNNVDRSSPAERDLAYTAADHPLPADPLAPAANVSGIWSGLLEAPETGFYNLRIEADAGAAVTLRLAGAVVPMANAANQWSNAAPIELVAGTVASIELTVENTRSMIARWQTAARPWEVIPARFLYAQAARDALESQYVRTFKVASLQIALGLSAAELAHLAAEPLTRIANQSWLNALAVTGATPNADREPLYRALAALIDYSLLRKRFGAEEDLLLEALRDPAAAGPGGQNRLLGVTRWTDASLTDLLTRFGLARAQLAVPANLRRVADAFEWLDKLGISASALIATVTNQPGATTVRTLQAALRARYSEADWLNVLQPINDELRTLQRDALVAFILQRMSLDPQALHIDTADRLFEYFLMDVKMEPCAQTSRVRHALSAVQIFIDRCLMALEARVAPSSIVAKQWQWMNRYRVWEANRKVFLYPENWLEPELRDDQSPIFREVMGELLQGDITEERAQIALQGYLAKLDEIAKLEPCGIYHEDGGPGTSDDFTHVVARTSGASRKYFYRCRENGSWTPWEQMKLDIEDAPVTPVVWKGRLFVFWLRVLRAMPERQDTDDTVPQNAPDLADTKAVALRNQARSGSENDSKVRFTAVLCWSERFNGAWQGVKTSSIAKPLVLMTAREEWFDRTQLRLRANEYGSSLVITVANQLSSPVITLGRFRLYNSHSEPALAEPRFFNPWQSRPLRILYTDVGELSATYYSRYFPFTARPGDNPSIDVMILQTNAPESRVVEPANSTADPWIDPFFMSDAPYSFFVQTTRRDPPTLTIDGSGFGYYGWADKARVRNFTKLLDSNASVDNLAARNSVLAHANETSARMTFELDPTRGGFLRRSLASGETWKYGDAQIGSAGAVIDPQH